MRKELRKEPKTVEKISQKSQIKLGLQEGARIG